MYDLLNKNIDIAIHALKDMESIEHKNLTIGAYIKRNDPRDILVSNKIKKLGDLHSKITIGSSSRRRELQLKNINKEINVEDHKFLSIIPLSHAYEHTAGFFLPILIGAEIYFNDNRDQIVNDLLSVKPTLMTAVPRLYEVLYKKINSQLIIQSKITQNLFSKTKLILKDILLFHQETYILLYLQMVEQNLHLI